MTLHIRKKDLKWLQKINTACTAMYDGLRDDLLPDGPRARLYNAGFIVSRIPHNPVHRDRWVITDKGIAALQENA